MTVHVETKIMFMKSIRNEKGERKYLPERDLIFYCELYSD